MIRVLRALFGRRRRPPSVVGQPMLDGGASTAMPAGEYDLERGDYDLLRPSVLPLDREIRRFVDGCRRAPAGSHAELRRGLETDALYTLIHFAKRCAVFALREPAGTWCEDGPIALAMMDQRRVDRRDTGWAVGLIAHAMAATGADAGGLVERAAALATPEVAGILAGARQPTSLRVFHYEEIRTPDGPGLIHAGQDHFAPTLDLTGLALRLAAHLSGGRYLAEPEIAFNLPSVWFASGQRQADPLLKHARAGIAVRGTLRKGVVDNPSWQMFQQWVVEMPTAEDAAALVGCVRSDRRRDQRFTVGVASGRLFSLLVAGSAAVGVDSFESPKTLRALADDIAPLLNEAASEP